VILVLGGTAEARTLAAALVAEGIGVTTSLAGRVANPRLPDGAVRTGGFGGPDALARWLDENAHLVFEEPSAARGDHVTAHPRRLQ